MFEITVGRRTRRLALSIAAALSPIVRVDAQAGVTRQQSAVVPCGVIACVDRPSPDDARPPAGTGRLVVGGLIGGAVGLGIVVNHLRDKYHSGDGIGLDEFFEDVALVTVSESVGLSIGVHTANSWRGSLLKSTLVSVGTGLVGFGLATALAKGVGAGAFALVPIAQLAGTIAVGR